VRHHPLVFWNWIHSANLPTMLIPLLFNRSDQGGCWNKSRAHWRSHQENPH
jgi:hypothetical protein